MKPFGASHMEHDKRIYNYRISRALNRIETHLVSCYEVENSSQANSVSHQTADDIIWATCYFFTISSKKR
uniref:Uncharacterized protein n=1 Tax=Ditylenchus dipsaci TaxID=166011 RepID=A0A915DRZ7_9BILA